MQTRDGILLSLMLVMLVAGACNVLLKDFMVFVEAPLTPESKTTSPFHQPIMWSLLMKCGMALCLPVHGFSKPSAPIYVFVISCCLGFVTDVFINMAYMAIAGSAIQMLRGGKVLLTALLSMAVLNRKLTTYQIVGGSIVICGITLVGFSTGAASMDGTTMSDPVSQTLYGLPWKAIGFCLCGECTQAVLWVYQENVLKKYDIAPLQLVGLEGSIGVVVGSLAVAIAHPLGIENLNHAVHQLSHSTPLMAAVICMLFTMAFFNYAGVGVTKRGSAVHRAIIDTSRSVLIWLVELALHWHVFKSTQAVGFCVLAVGALIYNHIIVVPQLEEKDEELPITGGGIAKKP